MKISHVIILIIAVMMLINDVFVTSLINGVLSLIALLLMMVMQAIVCLFLYEELEG